MGFSQAFLLKCSERYAECYEAETELLAAFERTFREAAAPAYESAAGRKQAERQLRCTVLGEQHRRNEFERRCFEIAKAGALHVFAYDAERWEEALGHSMTGLVAAEALYALQPTPENLVWSQHVASYVLCLPRDLEPSRHGKRVQTGRASRRLGRPSTGEHPTVAVLRSHQGQLLCDLDETRECMANLGLISETCPGDRVVFMMLAGHALLAAACDLVSRTTDLPPFSYAMMALLGYLRGRGAFTDFWARLEARMAQFLPSGRGEAPVQRDELPGDARFHAVLGNAQGFVENVAPFLDGLHCGDRDAAVTSFALLRSRAGALAALLNA